MAQKKSPSKLVIPLPGPVLDLAVLRPCRQASGSFQLQLTVSDFEANAAFLHACGTLLNVTGSGAGSRHWCGNSQGKVIEMHKSLVKRSLASWILTFAATSCGDSDAEQSNDAENSAAGAAESEMTPAGAAASPSQSSDPAPAPAEGDSTRAEETSPDADPASPEDVLASDMTQERPAEPGEPTPEMPTTDDGTSSSSNPTSSEPAVPDGPASTDCGISVNSYDISSAIPTVGIVTWSATAELDEASIVFGPAGGELSMSAPVDLAEPEYLTHLLGMKGSSDYDFQVVGSSAGQSCSSEVLTLTTGPVANSVPVMDRNVIDEDAVYPGFIATVSYGQQVPAFIFDRDGDPVWWGPSPMSASSARLSWDSKYVYSVTGNPNDNGGEVLRVSVDGTDVQSIPGTNAAHHDLAPLPDGNVAVLMHGDTCSAVAEITPDMTVTTTIDLSKAYGNAGGCHANSILYHPEDDTFTISDRSKNLYVKVNRSDGELHWQFGGDNPLGPHIEGSWAVNHGHQVLDNGHFLFFNNNGMGGNMGGGSPVHEFILDEQSLSAELLFSYTSATGEASSSLGDVQRLANGNTLITYSNQGTIHEINEAGELVQSITNQGGLGYAIHRVSLYGPPPK